MSLRINLLPIRAAKRANSAKQELFVAVGIVSSAIIITALWSWTVRSNISALEDEIGVIERQLNTIKKDRVRVQEFIKKTKSLEGKRDAIGRLEKQRVGPAKLLNDLSTILTSQRKVWLTELVERDGEMTFKGGAMENVNISDFQLALKRNSPYFKEVQLIEIKQVRSAEPPNVDYLEWQIACKTDYAAGS